MKHPEDNLQILVANDLDLTGWLWFHYPAGGKRGKKVGAMLKKFGTKRGVPDVMIFEAWRDLTAPRHPLDGFGVAIELKVKPNRPTAEQKQWLADLKARGWLTAVCYSLDEVRDVVSVIKGAF